MADEFSVGTKICVKPGVTAPDLPEFSIGGWSGTIAEISGKKASRKFIIEWDAATRANMPAAYIEQCAARQLYHLMACLNGNDVERVD